MSAQGEEGEGKKGSRRLHRDGGVRQGMGGKVELSGVHYVDYGKT